MYAGKSIYPIAMFALVIFLLAACGPGTTAPPLPAGVQIVSITERDHVAGQIVQVKVYNQCESGSSFRTQIQFSEGSSQSTQKEFSISAGVGGEVGVSAAAKVSLEASVSQKYANINTTEKGYQETVSIEVPARTQQEYTIIWRETRREGEIDYIENGETKFADYSYRVGLELASSTGRDISCLVTVTPSATPAPPTPTVTPDFTPTIVVSSPTPLAGGCISSKTWKVDSTSKSTLDTISIRNDACYDTGALGIFPDRNGVLHILDEKKRQQLASGIYTPVNNNSIIEFQVRVNLMYLVNTGNPAYINFAVAPSADPMTTKNTARFKLQVEDTGNNPWIYFVLADVGENNGSSLTTQHYEYGRTYTIRLELTGSVMQVYINNIRQNENLAIPTVPKVFYIGYNLPALAGVDVEVTNVKIDGELK